MFKFMSLSLGLSLGLMFLVVAGCGQDTTTSPVAERGVSQMSQLSRPHDFEFAMLDDFAVEITGANGSGLTDVEGGSVEVEVKADGLMPGHSYELNVTIDFESFATFGPVTATDDGEVEFEGSIALSEGLHRLDFFVTHDHSTGTGVAFGLFDRDLLLRCAPAAFPVIEAND